MKKILLLLSILVPLCSPSDAGSLSLALKLAIRPDKEIYSPGDIIKISYSIENISTEPVGFYVENSGCLELKASDISGKELKYHYDYSMQRFMGSIYPDEYVLLEPGNKREGKAEFALKQGKIEEFPYGRNKRDRGKPVTVHDGLYIDVPPGSLKDDYILIPADFGREIKLVLLYFTADPNPKNFTEKDCKDSGLSMDLFPDEIATNKISHSTVVENWEIYKLHELPYDEDKDNLIFYCQHRPILGKKAWIGGLQSNEIVVKIQQ